MGKFIEILSYRFSYLKKDLASLFTHILNRKKSKIIKPCEY